jgi:hypothetical protein
MAAFFTPFYIPSRESGKTWKVYAYKPTGRPAYVIACEGVNKDGIFTFVLGIGGDRNIQVNISGRATLRAVTEAGKELLKQMAANSFITAEVADESACRLVQ